MYPPPTYLLVVVTGREIYVLTMLVWWCGVCDNVCGEGKCRGHGIIPSHSAIRRTLHGASRFWSTQSMSASSVEIRRAPSAL